MEDENFECSSFKVVVVGNTGVGKSSLLQRFHLGVYESEAKPTVGVEHYSHDLVVQGQNVKLRLWDTAGQERFHSLCHAYYRGADGVIAMFDVTQQESFDAVFSYWIPEVKTDAPEDAVIVLVGNKSDLREAVDMDKAEELSKLHCMELELTSAKEGDNIEHVFHLLAEKMMTRAAQDKSLLGLSLPPSSGPMSQSIFLHHDQPTSPPASGCCSGGFYFW